jgi:hypothetical protein
MLNLLCGTSVVRMLNQIKKFPIDNITLNSKDLFKIFKNPLLF